MKQSLNLYYWEGRAKTLAEEIKAKNSKEEIDFLLQYVAVSLLKEGKGWEK